jgi:hypothetical protein
MNRATEGFLLIALFAASVVTAQTTAPEQPTPPSSATPSAQERTTTTTSPSSHSSSSETKSQTKMSLKDCTAQTRANHPQLSEQDALRVCRDAMSTTPRD